MNVLSFSVYIFRNQRKFNTKTVLKKGYRIRKPRVDPIISSCESRV